MCVKLLLGDLNPSLYPPHHTSTYTYGVTIVPRVCDGYITNIIPTFCPLVLDYYHLLKKKKKSFVLVMGIGWVIDWPMTILGYIDMGYSCYVVFTSVYKSNG